MASPLATEKVLRGALLSFQRSGLIPASADIVKLEQIPNDATDADISAILDTITFSSAPTVATTIRSETDVDVFIDSDGDAPLLTPNHFRVSTDQTDPPVTDPEHELATIYQGALDPVTATAVLRVGPSKNIASGTHPGVINIGCTSTTDLGSLFGTSDAVAGAQTGLSVRGNPYLDVRAANDIIVANLNGTVVAGGWDDLSSTPSFHIGDFVSGGSTVLESQIDGANTYMVMRSNLGTTQVPRYYVSGETTSSDRVIILLGGKYGEAWSDPTSYGSPTVLMLGDTAANTSATAYIHDRKTSRTSGSNVLTIDSDTPNAISYYLLRAYVQSSPVFRVGSDGNVSISGSTYGTGAGDVAETVVTDAAYEPGTVLAIRGGQYTQTTSTAQSNVAGVVSTKPGVEIGQHNIYDDSGCFELTVLEYGAKSDWISVAGDVRDGLGTHVLVVPDYYLRIEEVVYEPELAQIDAQTRIRVEEPLRLYVGTSVYGGIVAADHYCAMAVCGIVPVWCSTAGGNILGDGETLVSGPNGCAVVRRDPKPGTIIGKAQGRLLQPSRDVVKGLVPVLVNLQ